MTQRRLVLTCLGVALAAAAVAAALVLSPPVQTWAVRRALASRRGWEGTSVGRVSAGLRSVTLNSVRIEAGGAVLDIPLLEAELPTVPAFFGGRIAIRRLSARGWTLDLSRAGPATGPKQASYRALPSAREADFPGIIASAWAAEAAGQEQPVPAFSGVLARLRLPVELSLDRVDLDGEVVLPAPPGAARAHVRIGGGGIAPGSAGSFTFAIAADFAPAKAAVSAVVADGVLSATLGPERTFTRVSARINASATGPKFPRGVRLSADLAASRGPLGEVYTATLAGDTRELFGLQAEFSGTTRRLVGSWKVDLSDDDVNPFWLGRALPLFDAVGKGRFDTELAAGQTHVSGTLNLTADRLTAIGPELAGVGGVKLAADFDLTQRGALLRVDHLRATLAGAQPVLTVQGLQPFAFNADTGELQVADASSDVLGIVLQGVPVEWAQPFFSDTSMGGGPLRGELAASAAAGGLHLRSKSPLTLASASVSHAGRPLASDLGLRVDLSADDTPQGWQVECAGQILSQGPALSFSARCGRLAGRDQPMRVAGHMEGDLAALSAQPAARFGAARAVPAGRPVLIRGRVAADFTGEISAHRLFQAKIEVSGVEADPALSVETMPTVAAEIRADIGPDGRMAIAVPLSLERAGRKSDLALELTVEKTPGGLAVDGSVASSRLCLEDARILAAPWAGAGRPGSGPGAGSRAAPVPPAAGLSGQVLVSLRAVEGPGWTASDLTARLVAAPGQLRIEGLRAGLSDGSTCRLGATVTPGPAGRWDAYSGDVTVENFDMGPVLRALGGGPQPILEGRFDATAQISGTGFAPGALEASLQGRVSLSSRGGVFRALRADIAEAIKQSPSKLSEALGTVTSLFGKNKEAEKFIDKQGQVAVQITESFREVHYDQLSVTVERGADRNIRLSEFALISPEVRLGGTGTVTYQEGTPVGAQPLDLTLQVGARGRTGSLLKSAGLLGESTDDLGYAALASPVHLGGSLREPDPGQWRDLLVKAALRKAAGNLLDKLLGK